MKRKVSRQENEIFLDLERICTEPGYIHVLSYFCFRDNVLRYGDELTADDLSPLYSRERLIRTEISSLHGLMVKQPISIQLPTGSQMQKLISRTESLLEELHDAIGFTGRQQLGEYTDPKVILEALAPSKNVREPIFYGGESAYSFQYFDMASRRYAADAAWLEERKGFNISQAAALFSEVCRLQDAKSPGLTHEMLRKKPDEWTTLPCYTFSTSELSVTNLSEAQIEAILKAFCVDVGGSNPGFATVSDFNEVNSKPLLQIGPKEYVLFQQYAIGESLYETPFFWFQNDKSYNSTAGINRGRYCEDTASEFLARSFGWPKVFKNVEIFENKATLRGEIDVLVVYSDRVIVLQAKSKKLTYDARKGNDNAIRTDFGKAIQESYDQGELCARDIVSRKYLVRTRAGETVALPVEIKRAFIVCLVSENYPALNMQVREFLTYRSDDVIAPPLVVDVFFLDVLTEMLQSPLHLLNYLEKRSGLAEKFYAGHEHTILSYYLSHNLHDSGEFDLMLLDDDINVGLDVAMLARRKGAPGRRTPQGFLTKTAEGHVGALINSIQSLEHAVPLEIGLFLLSLGENALDTLNRGIAKITAATAQDGNVHDITLGFQKPALGITIHCSVAPDEAAYRKLCSHSELRKYKMKVGKWFGLCLEPSAGQLRFAIVLDEAWKENATREKEVASLRTNSDIVTSKTPKVGRNDKCPCGSGKKYKHCCLNK